jgi:hypothetical protein
MKYPLLKVSQLPAYPLLGSLMLSTKFQPWTIGEPNRSYAPLNGNASFCMHAGGVSKLYQEPIASDFYQLAPNLDKPIFGVASCVEKLVNVTQELITDMADHPLIQYGKATAWGAPWMQIVPLEVEEDIKALKAVRLPFQVAFSLVFNYNADGIRAFFEGFQSSRSTGVIGGKLPASVVVYFEDIPPSNQVWLKKYAQLKLTPTDAFNQLCKTYASSVDSCSFAQHGLPSLATHFGTLLSGLIPPMSGLYGHLLPKPTDTYAKCPTYTQLDPLLKTVSSTAEVPDGPYVFVNGDNQMGLILSPNAITAAQNLDVIPQESLFYNGGSFSYPLTTVLPSGGSLIKVPRVANAKDLSIYGLNMLNIKPACYEKDTDSLFFESVNIVDPIKLKAADPAKVTVFFPSTLFAKNVIYRNAQSDPNWKLDFDAIPDISGMDVADKRITNLTIRINPAKAYLHVSEHGDVINFCKKILKHAKISQLPIRAGALQGILTVEANYKSLKGLLTEEQKKELQFSVCTVGSSPLTLKPTLEHLSVEVMTLGTSKLRNKRGQHYIHPGEEAWKSYKEKLAIIESLSVHSKFFSRISSALSANWYKADLSAAPRIHRLFELTKDGYYLFVSNSYSGATPSVIVEDKNLEPFQSDITNWVTNSSSETHKLLDVDWKFIPSKFHLTEAKTHPEFRKLIHRVLTGNSYTNPIKVIRAIKALCLDKDVEAIIVEVLTQECKMSMHEIVYVLYS